jgi:hypothetical protein
MDDLEQQPDPWLEMLVYGPAISLGIYLLTVILIARVA